MDAEIVKAFELVLVLGAALAVGAYELWSLRRGRDGQRRRDGSEWSE